MGTGRPDRHLPTVDSAPTHTLHGASLVCHASRASNDGDAAGEAASYMGLAPMGRYLVTLYPAVSRSQVWGVTPRSRRTFFCGRPTRVLGRSSTNSTYRGTAKKGRFFTQ
jgi:hypothetical protein